MSKLSEFRIRELETFLLIFQERGIVKASKRLGVGQPAVSNTLAGLRMKFGDVLFTRPNCKPTQRCQQIARILLPIMEDLHVAVEALNSLKGHEDSDHASDSP
ncbi:LysR family transcriptional regulator [Pseudomonas syringae]|uniref:LysR family transcriptional regulator n=1 Tax=Pseudomonas syringae TaxID=317 RepID=UPI00215B604F|nr:LysR family transcriptional regulator [Pseudomonas syringae]MCR8718344.1 LysR family transcriptional regulator [Pseudomonas syringae]